ncbi:MAG TPA: hypothetical protein VIL74_22555 [Pyrinomonadaceae bacterium]|jgi:hypothetical protein
MKEKTRYSIPLDYENQLRSLCWVNDHLVDYVGGLIEFHLDGTKTEVKVSFGGLFDNAVATANGEYAVIYQTLGTKALLLKQGRILREINRSYYCAEAFEYPIAFLTIAGKVCIAHCPDEYNVIEIEEVETGVRLTEKERPAHDFFHSRLQISPDQKTLLSAGWIWHPLDAIELLDLSESVAEPQILSPFWDESLQNINLWEINNAAFIDDKKLLLSGTGDSENEDESEDSSILIYDLDARITLSQVEIDAPTGLLMPLDENFAVGFYEFPKIIDLNSGEVIHGWSDISTDKRNGSIVWHHDSISKIAIDEKNKRFAVGTKNSIEVIVIE